MSPTEVEACIDEMLEACNICDKDARRDMRAAYAVAARHILLEARAAHFRCSTEGFALWLVTELRSVSTPGERGESPTPTPPTREPALPGPVVGGEGRRAALMEASKVCSDRAKEWAAECDVIAPRTPAAYRMTGRAVEAAELSVILETRSTQNTKSSEGET